MSVLVAVSGLKELDRALGYLPKATARNVLIRTLNKAAQPIVDEAKRLVVEDTGTLKQSITASTRIKNKVGNAEYSAARRAGLGKDAARSALLAARRANKGQGSFAETYVGPSRGKGVIRYAHMIEFGTIHKTPSPYMRPAWDATKDRALDIIRAELGNEIIKAARRVGRSKKQTLAAKQSASMAALFVYEAGY